MYAVGRALMHGRRKMPNDEAEGREWIRRVSIGIRGLAHPAPPARLRVVFWSKCKATPDVAKALLVFVVLKC